MSTKDGKGKELEMVTPSDCPFHDKHEERIENICKDVGKICKEVKAKVPWRVFVILVSTITVIFMSIGGGYMAVWQRQSNVALIIQTTEANIKTEIAKLATKVSDVRGELRTLAMEVRKDVTNNQQRVLDLENRAANDEDKFHEMQQSFWKHKADDTRRLNALEHRTN